MNSMIRSLGFMILIFCMSSFCYAEDRDLRYFLTKVSSKTNELSKNDRIALLDRIGGLIGRAERIRLKLVEGIQTGELDIRYQDGKFWMLKLENDEESIEAGKEQIALLRKKSVNSVAAVKLFKSLKDLSSNFNAYNNMPAFSAFVGDLAPEMELWTDPVFYQLYLLALLRSKDVDRGSLQKENRPVKGKK